MFYFRSKYKLYAIGCGLQMNLLKKKDFCWAKTKKMHFSVKETEKPNTAVSIIVYGSFGLGQIYPNDQLFSLYTIKLIFFVYLETVEQSWPFTRRSSNGQGGFLRCTKKI